jgi:hypothetical protein
MVFVCTPFQYYVTCFNKSMNVMPAETTDTFNLLQLAIKTGAHFNL